MVEKNINTALNHTINDLLEESISSTYSNINNYYAKAINYIQIEPLIKSYEKKKLIKVFNKIIANCVVNLDKASNLTISGNYKMGDGDRLNMLNTILKEMNHQHSIMFYFMKVIKSSVKKAKQKKKRKSHDQ